MKKLILFLAVLSFIISKPCFADTKYNPMSGQWETVPSNYTNNEYNPMNNSWQYQPQQSYGDQNQN